MAILATQDAGGVSWEVELERDALLPGTIARGAVRLTAARDIEARGLVAALVATEHWEWESTSTDSNGHTQRRTVKEQDELRLAKAWARDRHLVRDVAICTTTEL